MSHKLEIRKLLTIDEVSSILRLHKETLRRFIREGNGNYPDFINLNPNGKVPRYRFYEDDVYKYLHQIKKAP